MKTPTDPWDFSEGPLYLTPKLPAEELVGPGDQPGRLEAAGFDPYPAGSRSRWIKLVHLADDRFAIQVQYRPGILGKPSEALPADDPAARPFRGHLEIANGTYGEHEEQIISALGSLFDVSLDIPEESQEPKAD